MAERCRTCSQQRVLGEYYGLDCEIKEDITYADFINQISNVKIAKNDGLPQWICFECVKEVMVAFKFALKVKTTDEVLRNEWQHWKNFFEENQTENIQEANQETTSGLVVNDLTEEYVMEEILENVEDSQNEDDELSMVEEILEETETTACLQPEEIMLPTDHLLEDTTVNDEMESFYSDNETNDDEYLIEYNALDETQSEKHSPKWKCAVCDKVLRGDVSYEGHMNLHKQLRPYKCPQCRCKFRCHEALKKHKSLRHVNTYNCEVCDKSFVCKDLLRKHVEREHKICLNCGLEFDHESTVQLHKIMNHNIKATSCPLCPHLNISEVQKHILTVHSLELDYENVNIAVEAKQSNNLMDENLEGDVSLHSSHSGISSSDHRETYQQKDKQLPLELVNNNKLDKRESFVQCKFCKKKLMSKNLEKHLALHEKKAREAQMTKTQYLCAYCPSGFKNQRNLHQHEKIHQESSPNVVYVCNDCSRQYSTQQLLETHRKQAHKERDNICSLCGNAFKLKNQLMNHMKLHLEKNIPCPHCDKKYARQFDLNVHLRTHTGELPYSCHLCEKRFAIKVRLTYHLQKHYGVKHRCKECQAEFNSRQKLKAHSFKHTGMPYRCQLCDGHGFPTRNVFKRHLARVHHAMMSDEALAEMFQHYTGKATIIKQINDFEMIPRNEDDQDQNILEENPDIITQHFHKDEDLNEHELNIHNSSSNLLHRCNNCGTRFFTLGDLLDHKKADHPAYICKTCGNTFKGHSQLSAHKRLHKERRFKCANCDKSYPRQTDLNIHMRSHTGDRPYGCHICDKRFPVKVRLTYHLQRHQGVRHHCPYCDVVYENRNQLKSHLFKHTGMPYRCEICPDVVFERRIRFANHMKRMHKKTMTIEELAEMFAKNTGKVIRFKKTETD
uniref:Protein krueppel n=1 Tax=Glossina pallidipes TaxID=7398 RepID=A0A1B0A1E4_GLOPL